MGEAGGIMSRWIAIVLGAWAFGCQMVEAADVAPVVTSWCGNSFSGANRKWVQDFVFAMAVNARGRCFTCSHWDEAHRESGIYQNGDVVGNCARAIGEAVAVNGAYAFVADTSGGKSGPRRSLVKRFTFDGKFTDVSYPLRNAARALAANDQVLAVSDSVDDQVLLIDLATRKQAVSIPVHGPGALALTDEGDVYVVSNIGRQAYDGRYWVIDPERPARILHFSKTGEKLPDEITQEATWKPTCLALDNRGRLMVGDDGPRHQIEFYSLGESPREVMEFGQRGGISAGTPGEVRPDKFWGITGCGMDQEGNIYVAMSEQGCILRKLRPDGTLGWELMNLNFVDVDDFDPTSDAQHAYGKQEHYVMDYSRPAGREWRFQGYTLDATRYPEDPRLWMANDGHALVSPFMRRLRNGKLYMFLCGMSSENLAIYRFDGEVAVPAGLILKKHYQSRGAADYPPYQPSDGEWIWRDANGDGRFGADEFTQPPGARNHVERWNWWVDSNGDIWTDGERNIRKFPLEGFDGHGNPIYSYKSEQDIAFPEPFNRVNRFEYFPESDTMYLTGYTREMPYDGKWWKEAGRITVRYDNWSMPTRSARWELKHHWETDRPFATPHSLAVAGDYLFVGYFHRGGPVVDKVYNAQTGQFVGDLRPGPEVGGVIGDIDTVQGIRAFRRSTGEYLIFQEDDRLGKVVLFRWTPTGP